MESGETAPIAEQTPADDARTRAKTRRAWAMRLGGTLIFLLLFLVLIWRGTIDLGAVVRTLAEADPWLVALSVLLYVPFVFVKAKRWRRLAAEMNMPIGRLDAWRLYAIGLGAGAFTPGQSGDLVKAWSLRARGYSLATAIWSSVLDRLFDLAGLGLLALLGVWVFGRELVGDIGIIGLLVAGALGGLLLLARRDLLIRYVPALSKLMGPSDQRWSFTPSTLLTLAGLTAASFAISVYRVFLMVTAVGVNMNLAQAAGVSALQTVAGLVPISVGGVGTRDAILVALFSQLGASADQAISVSALLLGLNITHALFGYLVWSLSPREK